MNKDAITAAVTHAHDTLYPSASPEQRHIAISTIVDAVIATLSIPQNNPRNLTLDAVCRREHLPIPDPLPNEPQSAAHALVLRAYQRPMRPGEHWTLTNTGGRKYRFRPGSRIIERYRGTQWEVVPSHHTPIVVAQFLVALTHINRQEELTLGE